MKDTRPRALLMTVLAALVGAVVSMGALWAKDWQKEFSLAHRPLTPTGAAPYSLLIPGFRLILASRSATLTFTVLEETKEINGIVTRVVEEREDRYGAVYEISRNFVALDEATGDVVYFGETVDAYQHGGVVSHPGAWQAYSNGAHPGLLIPGAPRVGMKFYQEHAPPDAMERAQVRRVGAVVHTPAGTWHDCVILAVSSTRKWLGLFARKEYHVYAPGIGMVQKQDMRLVSYGYRTDSHMQGPPSSPRPGRSAKGPYRGTPVPRSRLGAVSLLVLAPYVTSDKGDYVNVDRPFLPSLTL